ncbi:hypothetical protein AU210_016455 [Fusarium oxysporum f. sp. radicis-cucumerinum]|uniref:Uncharacterized protein n=1 Tax=Fusarium oxysporum f. sp. radicis-cucumerinum TaxID=327505 RepID=A0A2H3G769_FUSOX|nr:hypothetical protein AU210_016455 [Fusarium oxysporum f. sp. radicis-cucumerinum]
MVSAKTNLGAVGTLSHRPVNHAHYRTIINSKATKNSVNTPRRWTRRATSHSYVKDTRQPSCLIKDDIEGDAAVTSDSEDQPGPTKRKLTDDILEIADDLSTEAIDTSDQASKRTYNMLGAEDTSLQKPKGSDILVPSTLSQEEERENSIPFDFPDVVKMSLSLETIGQLKKRLNDEETQVEEARSAVIEAQVKELRAKVEKYAIERVLGDVERSVRQLQAASHHPAMSRAENNQGDAVIDSIFANFRDELEKASESKAKKEVLNVVLKHKCEELEASRQSVKEYEHQVKVLMEDLEKQQRAFALRRRLTASLLCADPETGVFGTELEFQLRQLDREPLDTDSGRY